MENEANLQENSDSISEGKVHAKLGLNRITRVVRSSLAVETLTSADGFDTALFVSSMYEKLNNSVLPVTCIVDSYPVKREHSGMYQCTHNILKIHLKRLGR